MSDANRQDEPSGNADFLADPTRWMPRLERLLEEQASLCASLNDLGRRQGEHIRADEMETLLGVLAERQRVIERFTEVSQELEPFRARWEELMAAAPPQRREAFRKRVDELSAAIQEVAARDEQDREALAARRQTLASELSGVQQGRGAVAAYGRSDARPAGPRYQDREG